MRRKIVITAVFASGLAHSFSFFQWEEKPAMISRTILLSLFLAIISPFATYGSSKSSSRTQKSLLPWELITEKFHEGSWFYGSKGLIKDDTQQGVSTVPAGINREFSLCSKLGDSMTFRIPESVNLTGLPDSFSVRLDRYGSSSWQKLADIPLSAKAVKAGLSQEVAKEGFFRLSLPASVQPQRSQNAVVYAIVCDNWKKDILSFCRKIKEDIELNPDPELFRSCIAVSHFDNAMELISKAPFLSADVLEALCSAVYSKQAFESGKCPDLVMGVNKIRFKRFSSSPVEEFAVVVPDEYTGSKPWPVFVHADVRRVGYNNNYASSSGLIDLWWHTVSHKDLRWKAFDALMQIIEQKLNIDKDRVYVDGDCRNGVAATALALNRPDQWAECSVSLGNSYRQLAGNAFNLPMIYIKGGHNNDPYIGFYHYTVKCFLHNDCRYFKHSIKQSVAEVRGASVPEAVREKSPRRILYSLESLGNQRAYWVRIDGREDENLLAGIDASVEGQTIRVKTDNVDAYRLNFLEAPVDSNEPVEIVENEKSLGFVTDEIFCRRSDKYTNASYVKNDRLHGPIWDAFTDPYVVVYGTGGVDVPFVNTCKDIAASLAKGSRCLSDVEMSEQMISNHNLILVGSAESNIWLARILDMLPIQIERGRIHMTSGRRLDGKDLAYVVIYPNPMNPDKYVLVCSAISTRAMAQMFDAYSQMKSIRPADIGIFEITGSGDINWHVAERLNTVWDWHDEWDRVLVTVNKKHAKWRWRQWIAKTVREQLGTDVVICEDPFQLVDTSPFGQVTYRDLFYTFKNVWFTKVKINGKSLRTLLTVPFESISDREVEAPIIEGVRLLGQKTSGHEKTLAISDLKDDKMYVAAMPEKCLNGNRLGVVLKDYEIINQTYLIPLLREWLESNSRVNIDSQLEASKLRIY
jgi:hypothetical protein